MTALEEHLERQAERSRDFFWNRVRWELVGGQLPPRGELVDVGAGTGFLGDHLARRRPGLEYRYVEPLPGLEQSLERRFGPEANLRRAPSFGAASAVTLLDVLEHQEDDRGFLADLAAKMAPGTVLLLTVPAMESLWSEWDVALGHHRRYSRPALREALSGLPLEITELAYLFPELIPLGLLRRWRSPAGSGGGDAAAAEFPDLPAPLNGLLYRLGRASTRARRLWPAGTSLFARIERLAEPRVGPRG